MSTLRSEELRFHGLGPVSLAVAAGECVTLTGPSGSGKTLLLRALADLDPHEGRIWLDDVECSQLPAPEWRRRVGLLPTESAWWEETVGAHFAHADTEALAALGFPPEVLGWRVERLSTGERQRLALLRLLALSPRALLLDEPTAHLDSESAERVERLVEGYRRDHAAPVLWVTHSGEQARSLATRQLRLESGRLVPA